jgi:F420-0:gamma-glutamyl ligase-like protein
MTEYYALALTSKYWKPGDNYIDNIIDAVEKRVDDGDFVVISEKALSTALNKIVDEGSVSPSLSAKLISRLWMRLVWGYLLGVLCHFGRRLIRRLRDYPLEAGSRHKQVALQHAGLLQALMWGSEGGIDGSNLPYSYVSLPLNHPSRLAAEIHEQIWIKLSKKVSVIIEDTDKTYSFGNFHFTPRPRAMKGIHSVGGVAAYVIGRTFRLRKRSTPLAVAGSGLQVEAALKIANIADRARGPGSGATVWDMAARFNVPVTGTSWDMLAKIKHKPIVIARKTRSTPLRKGTNHHH